MYLLSFEGLDGSGKSTQVHLLADWLRNQGFQVEVLREPGGTAVSEKIREMLLDTESKIEPFPELLLFSAARAQLVAERIVPLLEAGVIVICDRFFDSTTAYQGFGRQVADPDWLRDFHLQVTQGLVPERTYLVSVTPDVARSRREGRAPDDRMEALSSAFHERVAQGYKRLAEKEAERFVEVDGTRSVEAIATDIRADMEALLVNRPGTALPTSG